jgi:hypothetical protein
VQEKADANQLADHTARTLNLGLLLSALGHLVVLGPMANEGTGGRWAHSALCQKLNVKTQKAYKCMACSCLIAAVAAGSAGGWAATVC